MPGAIVLRAARTTNPNCGQATSTAGGSDLPGSITDPTLTLEIAHGADLFDAYMAKGISSVEFKAQATLNAPNSGCVVERLAPARDFALGSALNWTAPKPPSSATLTLPPPFAGTADYANGMLRGKISFFCPNVQQYVAVPTPAHATASIFP